MDVLLIQPPVPPWKRFPLDAEGVIPPQMLLYLAKPLIEKGFAVDILDLSIYQLDARRFKEYISTFRPALVGITCITLTAVNALKAAQYVKSVDAGITVVMGGPHVTFTARETLANEYVDIVVRGDGDINFPQVVEHFLRGRHSLAEIKGISYRLGDEIKENPRETIMDIDRFSYPSREIIDWSRYTIPGSIQASRGCPFKCHFCGIGAMADGTYRVRGTANILAEIDYLVAKLGITHLAFLDDTMTGRPELTKALCRHIIEKGYPVKWFCESRVDTVTKELIQLMARAGCYWIQFGFESGSEQILTEMNKKITPRQIEKASEICLDCGIFPTGGFLIGFPGDTPETVKKTIELAKNIKRKGGYTVVGVLTPLPGTYYYLHARELGITLHATQWDEFEMGYPLISTRNFTREELRTILFDALWELEQLETPFRGTNREMQTLFRGMKSCL